MTARSTSFIACASALWVLSAAPARAAPDTACEDLMQGLVKDVGGVRTGTEIAHPLARIMVDCPSDSMASADLLGSGNGFPPAFLQLVARVGADIAGLPGDGLKGEPARCLKTVTGSYKFGKVGRHHTPPPDMPRTYEGTLTVPHATIQCEYVGAEKRNAHFWVGGR